MKKLLLRLTLPLLFVGCTAELESKYSELESRVAKLETLCSQLNTNISSLQTIVSALQNNDYVTSVSPIMKGSDEIGYTIAFTKSKPITIYHGKNGADGKDGQTPVIGVKADADGLYYWTLNGEWLLDASGKKIRAVGTDGQNGENGITPQFKIIDGYWQISYDNGKTWSQVGKATGDQGEDGDSFFKSVSVTNEEVIMTLADGTVISLPKSSGLNIKFDFEDPTLQMINGQTIEIGYTLLNASEDALVTASSDGYYKLKVIRTNATTGKIQITAGQDNNDGYINVMVVDNGYSIGRVIDLSNFEVFINMSSGDSYSISSDGGILEIPFSTNSTSEEVEIPAECADWIRLAPATKSDRTGTISLQIDPSKMSRQGTIKVKSYFKEALGNITDLTINQYSNAFVIKIGNVSSHTLPLAGTVDCVIDWGDGSAPEKCTKEYPTHTYTDGRAEHIISVTGKVSQIASGRIEGNFLIQKSRDIVEVIEWGKLIGLTDVSYAMYGQSELTQIPSDICESFVNVVNFTYAFFNCSSLQNIPTGLFDKCPNVTEFYGTFYDCSSLQSIPAGLFDKCTQVTSFSSTFSHCSGLQSIPAGLFDKCTQVTSFSSTFSHCSDLQSIPAGLFDKCTQVTSFSSTFSHCSGLQNIPAAEDCARPNEMSSPWSCSFRSRR